MQVVYWRCAIALGTFIMDDLKTTAQAQESSIHGAFADLNNDVAVRAKLYHVSIFEL